MKGKCRDCGAPADIAFRHSRGRRPAWTKRWRRYCLECFARLETLR